MRSGLSRLISHLLFKFGDQLGPLPPKGESGKMPMRLRAGLLRACPARTIIPHTSYNFLPAIQFFPLSPTATIASLSYCPTQTSSFHTTIIHLQRRQKKRKDRYALEKSKLLKGRHVARKAELKSERDAAACDPVTGNDTEFTAMLDAKPTTLPSLDDVRSGKAVEDPNDPNQQRFNHFLTKDDLAQYLGIAKALTYPPGPKDYLVRDSAEEQRISRRHENAVEAVRRIVSLGNGSSKDKLRENKQRCIEMFGRHNTDLTLSPDPTKKVPEKKQFEKTPRAGPDTGSSEVQAAILTAKIRVLSDHVKNNKKDLMNKRNLRLLVHKRQKILKYLKRKEKGGIRYRNVMESLGLDDRAVEEELFL